MIEVDVETRPDNKRWAGAAVQWYASAPFIVQFGRYAGGGEWDIEPFFLEHPKDKAQIQSWLDEDDEFRAWNSKFDLHQLEAAGYRLPPEDRWHDGMVLAKLAANLRYGAALKKVSGDLFGEDARDPEKAVKQWLKDERAARKKEAKENNSEYIAPNYADVPMDIMVPYALEDIVLTARVSEHYQRVLTANEDIAEVYEFERKVMSALFAVERRGMPIDRAAAVAFEAELQDNLDPLLEKCQELADDKEFNPGSTVQLAAALEKRGADMSKLDRTKTGKYKVDADNLRRLDGEPLAEAVLNFKAESKLYSTYVRPLLHPKYEPRLGGEVAPLLTPEGFIHTNFNQLGAITGRMSSNSPNVQNWPRDDLRMRYLMRALPGMKIVTADLDSIELVLFAAYAGEGKLKSLVVDGEDMHTYTADAVGLSDFKRANGVEPKRQRGKTFNYSVLYGAGVNSIKNHFGVNQAEARRMLKMYHKAYPEVKNLQNVIEHKLYTRGYIKTYFGQRMYVDPRDSYKAVNYLVQGTAAGMLKVAMNKLHAEGAPMIALVHDEIVVHCPEDEAEHWLERLVFHMTDFPELKEKVPIGAEGGIVDRWSDAKTPGWQPSYADRIVVD